MDSPLHVSDKAAVSTVGEAGEIAPKKGKTVPSAEKFMATVFWDSHGVVLIDYLQKGKTITKENYASRLDHLQNVIKAKRPYLAKRKDNVRITHLYINLRLLLLNSMTYLWRCFHMSHIYRIWLPATTFPFQTWKKVSLDENSLQITRSEQR